MLGMLITSSPSSIKSPSFSTSHDTSDKQNKKTTPTRLKQSVENDLSKTSNHGAVSSKQISTEEKSNNQADGSNSASKVDSQSGGLKTIKSPAKAASDRLKKKKSPAKAAKKSPKPKKPANPPSATVTRSSLQNTLVGSMKASKENFEVEKSDSILFVGDVDTTTMTEDFRPLLEDEQPWNYDTAVNQIPTFEVNQQNSKRWRLDGSKDLMDSSLHGK